MVQEATRDAGGQVPQYLRVDFLVDKQGGFLSGHGQGFTPLSQGDPRSLCWQTLEVKVTGSMIWESMLSIGGTDFSCASPEKDDLG